MRRLVPIILSLLFLIAPSVYAESFWDRFKDPEDGKFDVTGGEASEDKGGFLPVPIIISEPALGGFGLGAGLLYMHEKGPYKNSGNRSEEKGEAEKMRPASISGIAAAYTLNDSWFIGGGHRDNWLNDNLRYTGGIGYASLNLDFYGIGDTGPPGDSKIPFNIEGFFLLQDVKYRLLKTDIFLGARYSFLGTEVAFDLSGIIPGVGEGQFDANDGGLGAIFQYDTRNNQFTPTRGTRVDASAMVHNATFGGDWTYQKYGAAGVTWFGVHPKVTLGLRLDGQSIYGNPPFYAVPFINLRGIPALRYQDDVTIVGEVEASWQAFPRWSVQGFLGSGRAASQIGDLGSTPSRTSYGTGFRYLIARKFGLHTGIDIARGPEETVVYIQIGHAWGR